MGRSGIMPMFGDRRIRNIEASEITGVVRAYRDEVAKGARARTGGRQAARALLAAYRGLFGYAVENGWISHSPATQLSTAITGAPPVARDRMLTDDEIRFVMRTDIAAVPVLRFLLGTGLRIGEVYNGIREGQYWVVPGKASKNGKDHRVWLSGVALAQLEAHPWEVSRDWAQRWLQNHSGGWTAHDLRRTFSTRLNGMGVQPYIVEKLLNHSFGGVMAVYNHAAYAAERQEALEAWSECLLRFTGEQSGENVVTLRAKASDAAQGGNMATRSLPSRR